MNEAMIKSIQRMMLSYEGHINDKTTRKDLRKTIKTYLKSFETEYEVVCNETNNTPETIDENKLIVDVYEKTPQNLKHFFILDGNGFYVDTKFSVEP